MKRKALRKYTGDITRVLDFLRARITFPDEGSLVCALYQLVNLAKRDKNAGCTSEEKTGTEERTETEEKNESSVEIVRLKNLFRTSPRGNTCYPALPTGYRHILVNVRLGSGIIAGE